MANPMSVTPKIVLASSSSYRQELLSRLNLPFTTVTPGIDETPLPGETPEQLVLRLARLKAEKVAEQEPDALIIGSDQAAVLEERILGKPGDHENAGRQLREMSGRRIRFLTGLCLYNGITTERYLDMILCDVYFRELRDDEIERYLQQERPYQCAGSFKSEQLGISLLERIECADPTALVGLPLISLCSMLRNSGVILP